MVPEKDELTKKRVLYIGSAVPLETTEGLESVQKPLSVRYPLQDDRHVEGIMSYVTVLPGGLSLQHVSDPGRILFFPISSLYMCAAVRCVSVLDQTTRKMSPLFVPLSSPLAGGVNNTRPAIFTAVTRRTEGRKVLECHSFICFSSTDALELVSCTTSADRHRKGRIHDSDLHHPVPAPRSPQTFDHVPTDQSAPQASANHVPPEFYEPLPEHGYFYTTKDSQIKIYTVEKMVEGEGEWLTVAPPPPPPLLPTLPLGQPMERKGPPAVPVPVPTFMTLPPPQSRPVYPVRAMPRSATMIRPRFFSPPPPRVHRRPVALAQPPVAQPPVMKPDPYVVLVARPDVTNSPKRRHRRRAESRSSSRGSVTSSSPDYSSYWSTDDRSTPRSHSPDDVRGPRVSRREQFQRRHRGPGNYYNVPGGPFHVAQPQDVYVRRQPSPHPDNPPHTMDRSRSAPSPVHRGKSKGRKKGKKDKRDDEGLKKKKDDEGLKKKIKRHFSKRVYRVPSDESLDSVGYALYVSPTGESPYVQRDFQHFNNKFTHERAFSRGMSGHFHGGPRESLGNALNQRMAERVAWPETNYNPY